MDIKKTQLKVPDQVRLNLSELNRLVAEHLQQQKGLSQAPIISVLESHVIAPPFEVNLGEKESWIEVEYFC